MAPMFWSDLPSDLLALIFKRSSSCVDLLQCGAVCVSWRSIILEIYREIIPQLPPLLLMPYARQSNGKVAHGLFNISTRKIHELQMTEIRGTMLHGSTRGWILTISLKSTQQIDKIHLLNPLSRTKIQLPLRNFLEPEIITFEISKVKSLSLSSSSSSPFDPGYTAVIIYHKPLSKIMFCKPCDQGWKTIDAQELPYQDITFFRGQLYAMDLRGNIFYCELKGPNPRAVQVAPPVEHDCRYCFNYKYLVESSSGQFLMVIRYFKVEKRELITGQFFRRKTLSFQVSELDLSTKEWGELKSVGDDALFLGQNESISIKSRNSTGCRANCIYFIDESIYGSHDHIGIYDLRTQSFEHSSQVWEGPFHRNTSYKAYMPPFYWISPDLYRV